MQTFDGKVAVVTGGGQGLGAAIVEALANTGAQVIAFDLKIDKAQALADQLNAAGCKASAMPVDISEPQQVEQAIQAVVEQHGRLDFLINNAGTDKTLSIEEISVDEWKRVIDVNLVGPFLMAKSALPVMRRQGSGHIVNIASTAAKRAWPNASAYHASKWGLMGFSHALHVEARQVGVKVTALVAGGMRTPFLLDRFPDINVETLQDPANVAETVVYVLGQPAETVIPEVMVIPMRETSWP